MKLNIMLMTLVTALAASVHAQSKADAAAQSKIVALEQLWNQAFKSGDTKALDSNINAIVLVNDDGSVPTKAELLASVKSSMSQASAEQ